MSAARPRVSIGMPVYNEAVHIDAAIRCLRAQRFADLEIIVCDNASTDGTQDIVRRHAAEDPRIRLEVAERNLGSTVNFLRALELADGEYFMWASGHDLWTPDLVEECVGLLDAHPDACLAYASADWIGPEGELLPRESGWTDTRGLGPAGRFFTIVWGNMHPVLGLMRRDLLRTSPVPAIVGGDLVLLAALALRGDFLHAARARWSRRELRYESSYSQKVKRYSSAEFGGRRSWLGRTLPLVELPMALVRVVLDAPVGLLDKLLMLSALVPTLALRYRVGKQMPLPEKK